MLIYVESRPEALYRCLQRLGPFLDPLFTVEEAVDPVSAYIMRGVGYEGGQEVEEPAEEVEEPAEEA